MTTVTPIITDQASIAVQRCVEVGAASDRSTLRMALPKGRMQVEVDRLLADSGLDVDSDRRG